jgi:hypothetical protein
VEKKIDIKQMDEKFDSRGDFEMLNRGRALFLDPHKSWKVTVLTFSTVCSYYSIINPVCQLGKFHPTASPEARNIQLIHFKK